MTMERVLSGRINLPEIRQAAVWASCSPANRSTLWALARQGDRQTSLNALWAMAHLPEADAEWLMSVRDEMIDMLLSETDTSKKRILLKLLREQEYHAEDIRTDFLDYCLSKINAECETYAVRGYCIYTAYKMCSNFPELTAELETHLELMHSQTLSPGLKSALKQTMNKIMKLKRL